VAEPLHAPPRICYHAKFGRSWSNGELRDTKRLSDTLHAQRSSTGTATELYFHADFCFHFSFLSHSMVTQTNNEHFVRSHNVDKAYKVIDSYTSLQYLHAKRFRMFMICRMCLFSPAFHLQAEWACGWNAGCAWCYLAFPAAADTHLPTPEGWKAE